jgi:putative aminopeptidase FrvX
MIGNSIGGALGNALATTLIGPLSGMVVGGLVESSLGFGRGAGELLGRVLDKVQGPQGEAPPQEKPAPQEAGALKKGFLALNNVIAQPIIGFLLDTTMVGNRLLAQEPIQSMKFEERPVAQVNRQRLIENFVDLAGINGPSGQEGAISQELEKRMQKLGVSVKRHEDGTLVGSLAATPGYESSPTVMLSAHLDTVLPTRRENIIVGERRIHTNEKSILGADDRAGIAEILEGLESVLEQGLAHPEVKLVFPVDEERGLVGSSRLRPEDISSRPTLGYVVDALDVQDVHLTNDAVIVNPKSVKYAYSQDDPLVQVLYQSMANAGLKPRPIPAPIMTGAGSDANTPALNSGLIRSIAIGAGERDMHTTLEYIEKDHLEQAARHVVGVLTNSCDLKVEGNQIVPRYPMPAV